MRAHGLEQGCALVGRVPSRGAKTYDAQYKHQSKLIAMNQQPPADRGKDSATDFNMDTKQTVNLHTQQPQTSDLRLLPCVPRSVVSGHWSQVPSLPLSAFCFPPSAVLLRRPGLLSAFPCGLLLSGLVPTSLGHFAHVPLLTHHVPPRDSIRPSIMHSRCSVHI